MGYFDFNVEFLSLLSLQKICASGGSIRRHRPYHSAFSTVRPFNFLPIFKYIYYMFDLNYYTGVNVSDAGPLVTLLSSFRRLLLSARRASPIWACSYVAFG